MFYFFYRNFNGKKKEDSEELTEEESETPAEEVQEEMIKDISSEEEPTNVPELEPEDAVIHALLLPVSQILPQSALRCPLFSCR